MPRICLLAVVFAVSAVAAPVPKDTELDRIGKAFGTVTEPTGCKVSMDAKNALTVKLDKAKPRKDAKPDEGFGAIPEPTRASFVRPVKGEFTATARFELKTDLTERPDDIGGVSVGLAVEYPSGESASLTRTYHVGNAYAPPDEPVRKITVAGLGSHTNDTKEGGFRGRSGGVQTPASGPLQIRIRCAGKKLLLEYQPDGKKWEAYDSLAIKEAGEAKLTLAVNSYLGAASEVAVEKLDVK